MKRLLIVIVAVIFIGQTALLVILLNKVDGLEWRITANHYITDQKIEESKKDIQNDFKDKYKLLYSSVSDARMLTVTAISEIQKINHQSPPQNTNTAPLTYMKLQRTEKELAELPPKRTEANYAAINTHVPMPCSSLSNIQYSTDNNMKKELYSISSGISAISSEIYLNRAYQQIKDLDKPY